MFPSFKSRIADCGLRNDRQNPQSAIRNPQSFPAYVRAVVNLAIACLLSGTLDARASDGAPHGMIEMSVSTSAPSGMMAFLPNCFSML